MGVWLSLTQGVELEELQVASAVADQDLAPALELDLHGDLLEEDRSGRPAEGVDPAIEALIEACRRGDLVGEHRLLELQLDLHAGMNLPVTKARRVPRGDLLLRVSTPLGAGCGLRAAECISIRAGPGRTLGRKVSGSAPLKFPLILVPRRGVSRAAGAPQTRR